MLRSFFRKNRQTSIASKKLILLGHDELKQVRRLRKEGKLDQVEKILFGAEPSPAVLDELRKTASVKAKKANKEEDWSAVVKHLEDYTVYANQWRDHCIKIANQAPPKHTESDERLLQEAKGRLEK